MSKKIPAIALFFFCCPTLALAASHLKNGSPVEGERDRSLPRQIVSIAFPGGTSQVPVDLQGVGQIITSVLSEGPKDLSGNAYRKFLFLKSAYIQFSCGTLECWLTLAAPPSDLPSVLNMAQRILSQAKWNQKTFAEKKTRVLASRQAKNDSMAFVVNHVMYQDLFDSHPLVLTGTGTLKSIESTTLGKARSNFKQLFDWKTAIVGTVGPMKPKRVVKVMNQTFETFLKKAAYRVHDLPKIKWTKYRPKEPQVTLIDKPNATDNQIRIAFVSPPIRSDTHESIVASFLGNLLGGGSDGLLQEVLREEKGLTYSVRARLPGRVPLWRVSTFGGNDQVEPLLKLIPELVQTFKKLPIDPEKFASIQDKLILNRRKQMELPSDRLDDRLTDRTRKLDSAFFKTYETRIRAVTPKEVKAMGKTRLSTQNAQIYVMGDKNTLLPILKNLGHDPKFVRILQINDM